MNKEDKRVKEYLGIARLMAFEIDQWIAISNKEEISYETYRECLDTCIKIDDTDTFCKIIKNYPEHTERFDKEFDELENSSECRKLTKEEADKIWNNIQKAIYENEK